MNNSSLLIIDVQNDFCPNGMLAVNEGDKVIAIINKLMEQFKSIVSTQDWHPVNHISFASRHNKNIGDKIFINGYNQVLWPDHCVQGTQGAQLHPQLNLNPINMILRKGNNLDLDSYSAFFENDKKSSTGLEGYLRKLNIVNVYIAGLATDYCVYYSAVDANDLGFRTFVILDATKGVDIPKNSIQKAISDMKKKGIKIIDHHNM